MTIPRPDADAVDTTTPAAPPTEPLDDGSGRLDLARLMSSDHDARRLRYAAGAVPKRPTDQAADGSDQGGEIAADDVVIPSDVLTLLLDRLERLRGVWELWGGAGGWERRVQPDPGWSLLVEDILILVARRPEVFTLWRAWQVAEAAERLAKVLSEIGMFSLFRWREVPITLPLVYGVNRLLSCEAALRNPPAMYRQHVTYLEPIDRLIRQGLTPHQIAKVYGWLTPDGHPDREKAAQAILDPGSVETPRRIVRTIKNNDWPSRPAALGIALQLGEEIARAREGADDVLGEADYEYERKSEE